MPSSPESPTELSSELSGADTALEDSTRVEATESEVLDTDDAEAVEIAPATDAEPRVDVASIDPVKAETAVDSFLHRPMTRRVALGVAAVEGVSEVVTGGNGFLGTLIRRLFGRSATASAKASSSASATATASATASASATDSATPSGDADPSSSKNPNVDPNNPNLPTPYEMWKMTPTQRLEAIRIPKEMLTDPNIAVRWLTIRNAIYNCGTDDREYAEFMATGIGKDGAGYNNYVYDTYYVPLFSQLDNFVPIDASDQGPRGISYRQGNYTTFRMDTHRDDMAPYHIEGVPDLSKAATIQGSDAVGYYKLHDSIDPRIADLLKRYMDYPCNVFTDESHKLTLRGLHFNELLQTVQPTSIDAVSL